ncbi:MAG: AhpC/TSA family protein [Odoribacteraceae bacterium]|jgi:thiol-disulfide isomerase/thioredoxin|nr:AhpC/TSA family protein [Odoribacteraceae bacterium]
MRNILFIVAVSGSLLAACNQTGFTVNGTNERVTEGKAYLITLLNDFSKGDTIATSPIVEGAFTFTGKVEGVQPAMITFEGSQSAVRPIFLENAVFAVNIGKSPSIEGRTVKAPGTPSSVTGGGPVQQVYSPYFDLQQAGGLKSNELQMAYFSTEDPAARDSIRQLLAQFQQGLDAKEQELIAANPDSYATAFQVFIKSQQDNLEQLKEKLGQLGENARASNFGQLIAKRVQTLESVAIGQVAPDFKLATPEGDTLSLHGITAKVKLIDFWASWCGPCRAENPNVVAAYAEYHPKGLEILGVSLDSDRDKWIEAIAKDNLTWKHGSDLQFWSAAPAKLYGVNSIPHTLLLDAENRIIAKNLRGDALKAKLAELLD